MVVSATMIHSTPISILHSDLATQCIIPGTAECTECTEWAMATVMAPCTGTIITGVVGMIIITVIMMTAYTDQGTLPGLMGSPEDARAVMQILNVFMQAAVAVVQAQLLVPQTLLQSLPQPVLI
jgi:hypothetical protein